MPDTDATATKLAELVMPEPELHTPQTADLVDRIERLQDDVHELQAALVWFAERAGCLDTLQHFLSAQRS